MRTDTDTNEHLATALEDRRLELGYATLNALARAAGISREALRPLMTHGAIDRYRPGTKAAVARALGWPHDAIDRIAAGLDPTELTIETSTEEITERLDRLEGQVTEMISLLQRLERGLGTRRDAD